MLYKGMKPSKNDNREMDFVHVLFLIWRKAIYGFSNYHIYCQCWITIGVF